jgi:DHA2 family multidrug resistance protein
VPIGVLTLVAGAALLRETTRRAGAHFDWIGFLLSKTGFSAALVALEKAPQDGWTAPHIIMPTMTVAMDAIPPIQIPRASALSNVLRQLFGAFGTGVFVSLLLDRTTYHQAMLSQTVTATNVSAVNLLNNTQLALVGQGLTDAAAQSAGLAMLWRQVTVAATVRSRDNCFYASMLISLAGVIPALGLKRGSPTRAAAPRHAVLD